MADVFISYARDDEPVARRVAKGIQASGFDVWWDADLPAHRAYSEVIEHNLQQARAVVVLWSKTASKSQWVRAEADYARNAGTLCQAQIDGSMPPLPFNQIQCADLTRWKGGSSHTGWSKLRSSVAALVSGGEKPTPNAQAASNPVRLRIWWVAAALALVIAIGAMIFVKSYASGDGKPVLAVLPFRSLDGQDDSLAAGMWEDTRQAIGRNPQLIVLGPNSAQELASKGDEISKRAADYVLQASVRTSGDRIRISADLVRTRDGQQLWSQHFDRKLDHIFALQSEIAAEIEGRLRGRLAQRGGVKPEHITTSGEVYALYSDARAKLRRRDNKLYPSAIAQLQQVTRTDPNFAPAWATLSQISAIAARPDQNNRSHENAQAYARKAIELAPNLAEGHAALAFALDLTGPLARAEIERAVALDPNDFQALTWLGNMRNQTGDPRGALEAYDRAVRIEPFFWPAVLNKLQLLRRLQDHAGIQQLLEHEKRVGAGSFSSIIEMQNAIDRGDLAGAANIGIKAWRQGGAAARPLISRDLWTVLLQLGYFDAAERVGPVPDFAKDLWLNDPKGLDTLESQNFTPKGFFSAYPLPQNAGRVYILNGRSAKLANMYLSLNMTPQQFAALSKDTADFLYTAPLLTVALKKTGHRKEAVALAAYAEARGKDHLRNSNAEGAALLARVYAVQGRTEEALALLTAAVNRKWLPQPPMLLNDLAIDPAFDTLKGDPRFERARQQVLATIARFRAQVRIANLD